MITRFYHTLIAVLCAMSPFSLCAESMHYKNFTESFGQDWQVSHYGEQVLDHFDYQGYVTFDGTLVQNIASIEGFMHSESSQFDRLLVKGHARIQNSKIQDEAEFVGKIFAINCDFKKKLTCTSAEKIFLSHCRTASVIIKKIPENLEPQIVELADYSEIRGPIVFEAGNGQVIADKRSTIESIVGGVLIIR